MRSSWVTTSGWFTPSRKNQPRLVLELFGMLDHLVGLLERVLNSQVTGTKPVQVHLMQRRFCTGTEMHEVLRELPDPVGKRSGAFERHMFEWPEVRIRRVELVTTMATDRDANRAMIGFHHE
jgi:hypothetical protein